MFEPIVLKEYCSTCGKSYTGTHVCPELFLSDFDRGFNAGRKADKPIELKNYCSRCGELYTGSHICPELFKSDFDRGFDAGKKSARRELGFSSFDDFLFLGE